MAPPSPTVASRIDPARARTWTDEQPPVMIRFLSIRDLAIVDAMNIEFDHGFSVLTGETGAGKSIIIGALGLLVGGRGGADLVRTGASRALVQATFETEAGEENIVRREIPAQGRGRIFIDDKLATASALRTLGRELVDIHGQHEHQVLLDPRTHSGLLDAYGGLEAAASEVAAAHERWRSAELRVEADQQGARDAAARMEFLEFQLAEIDRVSPQPGEDELLRNERSRLANADRLLHLASGAYATLYEQDDSVVSTLGSVWRQLDELADLDSAFVRTRRRRARPWPPCSMTSPTVCVRTPPPSRCRRTGSPRWRRGWLMSSGSHGSTAAAWTRSSNGARRLPARSAAAPTARRAVRRWRRKRALRGPRTLPRPASCRPGGWPGRDRWSPRSKRSSGSWPCPTAAWKSPSRPDSRKSAGGPRGTDRVELFLSANPGEDARPLARVASGGELSRVMLALKTLVATDTAGKTLVFDEVDAGIGGRAADRVGERLRALGGRYQVLCVTHAPQLAAYATAHYGVSKCVSEGRTRTAVERLSRDERIAELARLMTGSGSSAARASASELLDSRHAASARAAPHAGAEREETPRPSGE